MVAFSLLVICFSGVRAETVEETSENVCQNGLENGQGMNGEINPFGLGMQADLDGRTPGNGLLGLGMQADLDGWAPGDDTE